MEVIYVLCGAGILFLFLLIVFLVKKSSKKVMKEYDLETRKSFEDTEQLIIEKRVENLENKLYETKQNIMIIHTDERVYK